EPVKLVLVDDHAVTREGLRAMLQTNAAIQVVGEAGSGEEALARVAELSPQVVLMDVRMPGMDGLEATRRIKVRHPDTSVIILTSYDDEELVATAMRAGASGYLLKDASCDLLQHTIAAVLNGGLLIEASLISKALATFASPDDEDEGPLEGLTSRELEVLRLLAQGNTNKEIGEALYLAEITIKKHVQNIMAKLKASDRTQAAVKAYRHGLLR
ncbi:MAG: response regulator, partial [Dehalococcoidia bacterium]